MITILGLTLLAAAVIVAVAGALGNSLSAHLLKGTVHHTPAGGPTGLSRTGAGMPDDRADR